MPDGGLAREQGPAGAGYTPGGGWVPVPDPTTLTTEAVERATQIFRRELESQRELLETRMGGLDQDRLALRSFIEDVVRRFSEAIVQLRDEIEHRDSANRQLVEQRLGDLDQARALVAEDMKAIPVECKDRISSEREFILSRIEINATRMGEKFQAVDGRFAESKIAVDAAFAAAKEAVAEQNRSNDRAITVAQAGTKEQLTALGTVTDAGLKGLEDKITDARDRLTRIEGLTSGIKEATIEQRGTRGLQNSNVVVGIMAVSMLVSVVAVVIAVVLHG